MCLGNAPYGFGVRLKYFRGCARCSHAVLEHDLKWHLIVTGGRSCQRRPLPCFRRTVTVLAGEMLSRYGFRVGLSLDFLYAVFLFSPGALPWFLGVGPSCKPEPLRKSLIEATEISVSVRLP
jgi:hypothetical protein